MVFFSSRSPFASARSRNWPIMTAVPIRIAADRRVPHNSSHSTGPRREDVAKPRIPPIAFVGLVTLEGVPCIYPKSPEPLDTTQQIAFALGNPVTPVFITSGNLRTTDGR